MDMDQTQALDEPWAVSETDSKNPVAWLTVVANAERGGEKHPVYQGTTVLGRDPTCEICINSKKLSKTHAAIEVEGDVHFLHDMNSRNKTRFGDFVLKPHVRYELTPARQSFVLGNVECRYSLSEALPTTAAAASDTESDTGPESPFVLDTSKKSAAEDKVLAENSCDDDGSEPVGRTRKSAGLASHLPQHTSTPRSHQTQATLVLPDSEQDSSADAVQPGAFRRAQRILESQPFSESPDIGRTSSSLIIPNSPQESNATGPFSVQAQSAADNQLSADATLATQIVSPDLGTDADGEPTQPTQLFGTSTMLPGASADDTLPTQVFETSDILDATNADATLPTQVMDTSCAQEQAGADPAQPTQLFDSAASDQSGKEVAPSETLATQVFDIPLGAGGNETSEAADKPAADYDSDMSEPLLPVDHDRACDEPMDVTEPTILLGTSETDGCMFSRSKAAEVHDNGDSDSTRDGSEDERGGLVDDAATLAYSATAPAAGDEDARGTSDSTPGTRSPGGPPDEEATQAYVFGEDDGADDGDDNEQPERHEDQVAGPPGNDEDATQEYSVLAGAISDSEDDAGEERAPPAETNSPEAEDFTASPAQEYGLDEAGDSPTQAYGLAAEPGTSPTQVYGIAAEADSSPTQEYGLLDEAGESPTQAYGLAAEAGNSPTQVYGIATGADDEPTQAYGLDLAGAGAENEEEEATQAYGLMGAGGEPSGPTNTADDEEAATQAYGLGCEGKNEECGSPSALGGPGGTRTGHNDDEPTQAYGLAVADTQSASVLAEGPDDEAPTMAYPIAMAEDDTDLESQEYGKVVQAPLATAVGSAPMVTSSAAAATSNGSSLKNGTSGGVSASPAGSVALSTGTALSDVVAESQATASPAKSCLPGLQSSRVGRGVKRTKRVLFVDEAAGANEDETSESEVSSTPPKKRSRAGDRLAAQPTVTAPKSRRGRLAGSENVEEAVVNPVSAGSLTDLLPTQRRGRGRRAVPTAVGADVDPAEATPPDVASGNSGVAEQPAESAATQRGRGRKAATAVTSNVETVETKATNKGSEIVVEVEQPAEPVGTQRRGRGRRAIATEMETVETKPASEASGDSSVTEQPAEPAAVPRRGRGRKAVAEAVAMDEASEDPEATEQPAPEPAAVQGRGRGRKASAEVKKVIAKPQDQKQEEEDTEAVGQVSQEDRPPASSQRRGQKSKAPAIAADEPESEAAIQQPEKKQQPSQRRGRRGQTTDTNVGEKDESQAPEAVADADPVTPQRVARSNRRSFEKPDTSAAAGGAAKDDVSTPRVMLTGIINEELRTIVTQLGGKMEDDSVRKCTHLVTDRIARTIKFLSCLSMGKPIVSADWLFASKKAKRFIDHAKYAVKDAEKEATFKFDLEKSRKKAAEQLLLEGQRLHLCASVKPPPDQLAEIVRCAGGEVLTIFPGRADADVIVVAALGDAASHKKCQQSGHALVTPEYILTGVLRQEASVDEYRIADEEPAAAASGKRKGSAAEAEKPASKRARRKR